MFISPSLHEPGEKRAGLPDTGLSGECPAPFQAQADAREECHGGTMRSPVGGCKGLWTAAGFAPLV